MNDGDFFFLGGGGEMGARVRSLDWSRTGLGTVQHWPQSLRTSAGACLGSGFPIVIWWGPRHVQIYNDAYAAILGNKHPRALGQDARDCWPQMWHAIGPRIEDAYVRGVAAWSENVSVLVERRGLEEECYFTFSYSPVRDEDGIGGVFCIVIETTRQVLSERRLRTLRDLSAHVSAAIDEHALWQGSAQVLARNRDDVPFVRLYRAAEDGARAVLVATAGVEADSEALPRELVVTAKLEQLKRLQVLDAERSAAILALRGQGASPFGYVVAGLSRRRSLDEDYADFLVLASDHISTGLANARAHAEERRRALALAELRQQSLEQQRRTNVRLKEQLEEQETLMEALPVGVFIARDRACSMITANAVGAALLRLPRSANVSKTGAQAQALGFRVFHGGDEVAPGDLPMQRAARTGEPVTGAELDVVFADGDSITLYEYASPLFDANGQPRGSVGVFVDITERKRTERMLQQQTSLLAMVATGRPVADCLQAICDAVPSLSAGTHACIMLTGTSQARPQSFVSTAIASRLGPMVEGLSIADPMISGCATAVGHGAPVTCADIAADSRWSAAWRSACLDHGVLACHCEPIRGAEGFTLGSFMLCLDRARLPREHEQRLARFCARIASIALERDRSTAALLESEARLREADRRKDEFLATLAHELRNPLAPLSNALQLMRGHPPRARAAERLHEMMRRQVDHLVRLVDDLLETSRITRGVLELRKQRIEVAGVVANAIETTEPLMQSAGHALTVSVPAQPLWLEGDPVRLSQILANLLNNAAKYTAPGGEIALRVEPRETVVRIGVRDNGPGIDADALPRIFDMFRRNPRLDNGGEPGLGIGLALARRLAELHGGTLEAHSDGPGTGAEFVVLLPLAIDQVANGAIEPMAPADRLRMRVLIVDDNVDAAQSLAMVLEGFGAEVGIAHDGAEALRLFPEQRPVAVLLDIGMPGMDGYEVARRIRAQYPDNPAVLVALTGWGQEDDRRRAQEAGFNHHIIKPADVDALRELLVSLERRRDGAGADAST